jgi:uracil-DNA glycosylase
MTEHTIVVLGEAWGRDEDTYKRPFMGATGRELNRLCEEAGLLPAGSTVQMGFHNIGRDQIYSRANIHLTNVFNFRPPGNRIEDLCGPRHGSRAALRPGKYLRAEYYPELARLEAELAALRPNLILGLGATALWFLLDTTAITKMRGTTLTTPCAGSGVFAPSLSSTSSRPRESGSTRRSADPRGPRLSRSPWTTSSN